jgi:hypothetical protein
MARDLRPVYTAVNQADAARCLDEFHTIWGARGSLLRGSTSVILVGASSFAVSDTSAAMEARMVERWRVMSALDRLEQVAVLSESCERLAEAGVRLRYPSAADDEVRLRVFALRLGRDLMVDVYGWDPAVEGW